MATQSVRSFPLKIGIQAESSAAGFAGTAEELAEAAQASSRAVSGRRRDFDMIFSIG